MFPLYSISAPCFIKHFLHSRRIFCQFFNAQIFRLIVRQPKLVFGGEKGFPCFLQMGNRFINLVNGRLKFITGNPIVARKPFFKGIHIVLKVQDIYLLMLCQF